MYGYVAMQNIHMQCALAFNYGIALNSCYPLARASDLTYLKFVQSSNSPVSLALTLSPLQTFAISCNGVFVCARGAFIVCENKYLSTVQTLCSH